jgi:hypothetical protein
VTCLLGSVGLLVVDIHIEPKRESFSWRSDKLCYTRTQPMEGENSIFRVVDGQSIEDIVRHIC